MKQLISREEIMATLEKNKIKKYSYAEYQRAKRIILNNDEFEPEEYGSIVNTIYSYCQPNTKHKETK